jgi:hypothetical protein
MPTTRAQTQEVWETRISILETKMESITTTIQVEVKESLHAEVHISIRESMEKFTKGKHVVPNLGDPHHSHYEHTHSSHSPWGSSHSGNTVPKVDMHKFDGSNPIGWVSKMKNTSPSIMFEMMRPNSM